MRASKGHDLVAASPHPTLCNCQALRQATRQLTQLYDGALAGAGLRVTQYSLLAALARRGPSTLQELAADLVMDRSTLGHNLRPLEREGLVALGTDEQDKRARRLSLTASGKKRLEGARGGWQQAQRTFESRFGKAEAAELRRLLQRAVTALGGD
jgi:DNA-binding MarR family transcriptional regulator